MPATLSPFERALLEPLAESEEHAPAGLAIELDEDLSTVLDTVEDLQDRGLVERQGFDTCRLTDRGCDLL
jgi:Mn-dependent DtxR family transcriptional regulator